MWKLSAELRQRLDGQRGDNSPPLPMNCFFAVHWKLNSEDKETTQRCYSTFGRPVIMNGNFYSGNEGLLSFNEESDREFIMNEDNLIYGGVVWIQGIRQRGSGTQNSHDLEQKT